MNADSEPLLGALMRRPLDAIRRRIIAALHANGFDDLVPAHLAVLRHPGPTGQRPGELAAQANMSKQALNYLLGQLESLGYVERRCDAGDQRSRRVHLTARGESTIAIIRAAVREVEDEWKAAIGADEVERVRAALQRINATIDDRA